MSGALLLVHGDEGLGMDEAVAAFAREHGASSERHLRAERSPDESVLAAAAMEASMVGLFGSPLVVVHGPLRAAGRSTAASESLFALVSGLPDGSLLAFVEHRPSRDVGRPPALLTRLAEAVTTVGGRVEEHRAPRKNELRGWIVQRAAARGVGIDPPAAALLADRIGGIWESDVERGEHTRLADAELGKLAIAAGEGPISAPLVESLVTDTRPSSVFAVTNALDRRDPAAAADALRRAISDRQPMLVIMTALDNRLADLLAARDLIDRGANAAELTRRLGRGNARQAERVVQAARLYREDELVAMLRGLFETDLAVKSNRMEPEAALAAWVGEYLLGAARPARR